MVHRWSFVRVVSDDAMKMAAISRHSFNIEPYGKKIFKQSSALKLLGLSGPKFNGVVLSWSPIRITVKPV